LALSKSADEHASTASSSSCATLVTMSEVEFAAWERAETLKSTLKESSRHIKVLEQQLEHAEQAAAQYHLPAPSPAPVSGTLIRIDQYKRRKGTRLTEEERRAVLHCYEVCHEEKRKGTSVSRTDPFLRTAVYFGLSQNTVRDAVAGKNLGHRRGMYSRFISVRLIAADLRQRTTQLNLSGSVVTLKRLHKFVRDTCPSTLKVPGRETIRKIMCSMGFTYNDAVKTKNFVETAVIRQLRRRYLQQRYSDRFKNALFAWMDESYCNHQQTWFSDGMTVFRKNNGRGRRYVIVHAGCQEGWIGEPKIWEASSSNTVPNYHENMNARVFEEYMDKLCQHCVEKGHKEVVVCMDNAKYHRREFTGPDCEQSRRTLSQLNKSELIDRLLKLNSKLDPNDLQKLKKPELYSMARLPEYQIPLAVEEILRDRAIMSCGFLLITLISILSRKHGE
ncbi:hypothetical protein BGX33_011800, partial [Mortierella sp. NVP41]